MRKLLLSLEWSIRILKHNRAKAKQLKEEMEKACSWDYTKYYYERWTRVDGKYNQDLDPSILLIELGGIENKEDELNRTIAVIAKAEQRYRMR